MNFGESGLMLIVGILMVVVLIASLLPFLPGPFLLWAISLVYGLLTGFQHLTVLAVVVITALMVIGSTKDFWMLLVGIKAYGVSCSAALGMMLGGTAGTFLIPIPIVGTVIGMIIGAVVLELLNLGDMRRALRAGGAAFKSYLLGMMTEIGFNLLIVGTFFGSLWLTTR